MQRSIATVSLSGTLPEKLEAIAAAGFDGVEIFENDLLHYAGSPREIRQLCADLGIAITLFQPFRDFEGCKRERLQKNLDRAERKFDLMQELGTDLVLVCSNVQADALGEEQVLVDDHWPSTRVHVACASATKVWPGADTSIPGNRCGTWCARPITPRWA